MEILSFYWKQSNKPKNFLTIKQKGSSTEATLFLEQSENLVGTELINNPESGPGTFLRCFLTTIFFKMVFPFVSIVKKIEGDKLTKVILRLFSQ